MTSKLLLALAAALSIAAAPARPIVKIGQGSLSGETLTNGTRVFRGIPYARPPVGDLRWKPPVAADGWRGIRAATQFGAACMQARSKPENLYADDPQVMSEDCLSLNVWSPKGAKKAPVMVWIHGGALVSGYTGSAVYDAQHLAAKGVVVVSINYRLGILGFLAHAGLSAESPQHVSGNYGLLDQIAALKWVRANVAAFGGDPANVTIFGESAGALSVMDLLASPLAKGLYSKAIAESAYMVTNPALKTPVFGAPSAEQVGAAVSTALKAPDVAALRAIPAATLINAAPKLGFLTQPTIDGWVLGKQLVETFDAGEQAQVTLLAGFNAGEIRSLRMLAPPVPADAATYTAKIRENYGNLGSAFLDLYPATDLEGSIVAASRDGIYGWTAQRLVEKQSAAGQRAYLYYFQHSYPAADALGLPAFHASELPYVFGLIGAPLSVNWPNPPVTATERALSGAMIDYWTSFAKTGVPVAAGAATWAPYAERKAYMAFRDTPVAATDVLPGSYTLAEEVVCRRRAANELWFVNIGLAAGKIPQTPCARTGEAQ